MRSLAAVTVVVVLAVIACGDDEPEDGGSGTFDGGLESEASEEVTEEVPPPRPPDDGCDEDNPYGLTVTTDSPAEVQFLDQVTACTDEAGQSTLLVNDSDAVWTIRADGVSVLQNPDEDLGITSFLTIADPTYAGAKLVPGVSMVVDAEPAGVEWTLHPGLSTMWLAHEQLIDLFEGYGDQVTDMLAGRSLRRQALVTCASAALDVAGESGELLNGAQPSDQFLAGLGITASLGECGRSWLRADDDATRRFGRTPTWADDVVGLANDTRFLSHTDDLLSALNRAGKALLVAR